MTSTPQPRAQHLMPGWPSLSRNSIRILRYSLMRVFALVVLSFVGASTSFAKGSQNQCMMVFESVDAKEIRFQADLEMLVAKMRASVQDSELALTHRGIFASRPELTAELEAAVAKYGVSPWGVRIFVVRSIAEAIAHSAQEADLLKQGNYLIRPDMTPDRVRKLKGASLASFVRRSLREGSLYYIDNTFDVDPVTGLAAIDPETQRPRNLKQTVRIVRPDVVNDILQPDQLVLNTDDLKAGPFIIQSGWSLSRLRGVIDRHNIFDPPNQEGEVVLSGKYKKARALARKLHSQGFTFHFNRDFAAALNRVRDQLRRNPVTKEKAEAVKKLSAADQAKFEESLWVANSRYKTDPALYASTLEAFKNGRAFSAEVWNEKGELVGGIIGTIDGGVFSPESTFYDAKRYPEIGSMFSLIAVDMLGERLEKAGLRWMDAAEVSPFTKTARGQLVTLERFFEIKKEMDQIGSKGVDLTTPWLPPAGIDSQAQSKKQPKSK